MKVQHNLFSTLLLSHLLIYTGYAKISTLLPTNLRQPLLKTLHWSDVVLRFVQLNKV